MRRRRRAGMAGEKSQRPCELAPRLGRLRPRDRDALDSRRKLRRPRQIGQLLIGSDQGDGANLQRGRRREQGPGVSRRRDDQRRSPRFTDQLLAERRRRFGLERPSLRHDAYAPDLQRLAHLVRDHPA